MHTTINQEVSVVSFFSASKRLALPHIIHWQGTSYDVGSIGFHHSVHKGSTLFHVYELTDREESIWMRLLLNTSNLHWTLEAVSDGQAD